jgi:hypothetical protein
MYEALAIGFFAVVVYIIWKQRRDEVPPTPAKSSPPRKTFPGEPPELP